MNRFAILVFSTILVAASAQAQNLYKWVDEDGNITYQDSPPPGASDDAKPYAEDPEVAAERSDAAGPDVSVTLYTVPVCDACDLVRNLLEKNRIPFEEKDAGSSVSVQDELMELAGQLSVPMLAIGDGLVSGYSSNAINTALNSAGFILGGTAPVDDDVEPPSGAALSDDEVTQQAADAAAELTADLEELGNDPGLIEDVVEEIPEEEQIKVRVGE